MLSLRAADPGDRAMIFEWANDPETRASSFASDPIPWSDHCDWFDRILNHPARRLFIVLASSVPIGQARLVPHTADGGEAGLEISISLAPGWRRRGLGAGVVRLVTGEAGGEMVHAYVKADNEASRRVFLKAGYVDRGTVTRDGMTAGHFTSA